MMQNTPRAAQSSLDIDGRDRAGGRKHAIRRQCALPCLSVVESAIHGYKTHSTDIPTTILILSPDLSSHEEEGFTMTARPSRSIEIGLSFALYISSVGTNDGLDWSTCTVIRGLALFATLDTHHVVLRTRAHRELAVVARYLFVVHQQRFIFTTEGHLATSLEQLCFWDQNIDESDGCIVEGTHWWWRHPHSRNQRALSVTTY